MEDHGTLNAAFNGRHARFSALGDCAGEDVVVRDVAGGSFDADPVRAELSYEGRRQAARGSRAGEENDIPCTTPRHPAGNAATNTSKTSDDQVGCVCIKPIYRLCVQQCLAVLATWHKALCRVTYFYRSICLEIHHDLPHVLSALHQSERRFDFRHWEDMHRKRDLNFMIRQHLHDSKKGFAERHRPFDMHMIQVNGAE